ncbi:hypothetical protein ACA910_001809 [Epithemia clementina (nom. ined.)]
MQPATPTQARRIETSNMIEYLYSSFFLLFALHVLNQFSEPLSSDHSLEEVQVAYQLRENIPVPCVDTSKIKDIFHSSPSLLMEAFQLAQRRVQELDQGIQRIYYINTDENFHRKSLMESVLSQVKPPVPYQRFPAIVGSTNGSVCVSNKSGKEQCRNLSGKARSLIQLMDTQNMSGVSIVLEDQFLIARNLTKIQQAIDLVPVDWDVIRFLPYHRDELNDNPGAFHRVEHKMKSNRSTHEEEELNSLEIYRIELPKDPPGNYVCGGVFAMVWRESSLHKLHRAWSRRPYQDTDCALADEHGLQSYFLASEDWEIFERVFGQYEWMLNTA